MTSLSSAIKLAALAIYAILFVVGLRARTEGKVRGLFLTYVAGLAIWQSTAYAVNLSADPWWAIRWYNLSFAGIVVQSIVFYPFTRFFVAARRGRALSAAAWTALVVLAAVGVLGLAIDRVTVGRAGYYVPIFGPPIYASTVVAYGFWALGIGTLAVALRRERRRLQRTRIRYLLAGSILVMAGVATNFTPLQDYPVDILLATVNALLMAYAVVRYRLLEADAVLRQWVPRLVPPALAAGLYGSVFFALQPLLPAAAAGFAGLAAVGAGILLARRRPVAQLFLRLLTAERRRHDEILARASREITATLDLEALERLVAGAAREGSGSKWVSLYRLEEATRTYVPALIEGEGAPERLPRLAAEDLFATALREYGRPAWVEELRVDPSCAELLAAGEPFFQAAGAAVIVPLSQGGRLVGVLVLAPKPDDSLYSDDDLRFVLTLSNLAAVALQNAEHHREVSDRLSEQTFLFVASEAIVRATGLEAAVEEVVRVIADFLKVDRCGLVVWDERGSVAAKAGVGVRLEQLETAAAGGAGAELPADLVCFPLARGEARAGVLVLERRATGAIHARHPGLLQTVSLVLAQGLLLHRYLQNVLAMKERMERLVASVVASGELILTVADDGRITDMDSASAALLGYEPAELIGRYFADIVRVDSIAEASALVSTESFQNRELTLRRKDGREITVLVSSSTIRGAKGQEHVIVARDITDVRALERRLMQAQKMESLGTLTGGIAHDFNNILTAILGHAELARMKLPPDSHVAADLDVIQSSGRRAADLTRRLLTFARSDAAELQDVDMNRIVRETVDILRETLPRSIEVRTALAADLPRVRGDRSQLHQVVLNLCVNARDAMPSGGVLEISTSVARPTAPDGPAVDCVRLTVCDSGCGIPREILPRIFDPFFTTKKPGQGTGLGLSVVYGVAKTHGGSVEVWSEVGVGTRIDVHLPIGPAGSETPEAAAGAADIIPDGSGTVLVVDDEPAICGFAREVLSRHGYTVLEAEDGAAAVSVAAAYGSPIDLAIVDLSMPRMGGVETSRRLRELQPRIKVILTTGFADSESQAEIERSSFEAVVRKPFTAGQLLALARRILGGAADAARSPR